MWRSIERLAPLGPTFMSVTYGAGGSTRERTHADRRAHGQRDRRAAGRPPHLRRPPPGTRSTPSSTAIARPACATSWRCAAIRPAASAPAFEPHPGGYKSTADLVAGIRSARAEFELSVSAYPEKHPESPSVEADFDVLKAKVDAGANRAITQFFFDNGHYLRYVDEARARGIHVPIVPGIVPVHELQADREFRPEAPARACPPGSRSASRGWRTTPRPAS